MQNFLFFQSLFWFFSSFNNFTLINANYCFRNHSTKYISGNGAPPASYFKSSLCYSRFLVFSAFGASFKRVHEVWLLRISKTTSGRRPTIDDKKRLIRSEINAKLIPSCFFCYIFSSSSSDNAVMHLMIMLFGNLASKSNNCDHFISIDAYFNQFLFFDCPTLSLYRLINAYK